MKVKESDLVIGAEYYLEDHSRKSQKGIFIGFFGRYTFFHPTEGFIYNREDDGTVCFLTSNFDYEEV